MSLQLILKNSSQSGKEPTASQLSNGELALNYHADGPFLSCKDTAGVVRRIAGVWINASAPTTPTPGEFWLDISLTPSLLKVYQDSISNWVPVVAVYPASTTQAGVVELATNAETQAGTDANIAVTPVGLQSRLTTLTGDVTVNSSGVTAIKSSVALAGSPTTTTQSAGTTNTTIATTSFVATAVDGARQGLTVKLACRAATTANITLSAAQTIDDVAVVAGDRVLVKNQTTGSQNGIYVCAASTWTRSTDFDADSDLLDSAFTFVEEGTTNADSGWVLATNGPITLGTTALVFAQFSGAGQITAGTGLTKTGNTIDVIGTAGRIVANADSIDLASGIVTAGTYKSLTVDTYGRVTAGTNPTTIAGYGITDAPTLSGDNALTGANTFTNATGQIFRQAATQDGVLLRGRAGGTGSFSVEIIPTTLTASRTLTAPNVSGTLVTTGDTGSVTSTMILDGTIVNADINASAAIAGTKISPDFGTQNRTSTGTSTAASFIPTSSTVPTNGVYLAATNSVALATNSTGRLFVDASGTVSVANGTLKLSDGYPIIWGSSAASIYSGSGVSDMTFTVGSTERMRINGATGFLGLGTSNPGFLLDVAGQARFGTTPSALHFGVGNAFVAGQGELYSISTASMGIGTAGSASLNLYTNSSERLRIDSSGRVVIGSGSADSVSRVTVNGSSDSTYGIGIVNSYSATANSFYAHRYFQGGTHLGGLWWPNSTSELIRHAALNGIAFHTGSATEGPERLRITSGGNVGVGTSSPGAAYILDVAGAARFNGGSGYVSFGDNGYIRTDAANELRFQGGSNGTSFWKTGLSSESVRIDNSGRVGIGTSSPSSILHLATGAGVASELRFSNSANNWSVKTGTSANSFSIVENQFGGTPFHINAAGNVGIGTSSPSQLLHVAGNIFTTGSISVEATTASIYTSSPGVTTFRQITDTSGALLSVDGSWPIRFNINGTERARIDSSGNVGIGTSSPRSVLDVSGTSGITWTSGVNATKGLLTVGTQGTSGGTLYIHTPSLSASYGSGLAVDGSYSNPGGIGTSVVNLKALGVFSGGGYDSALTFHTSVNTTSSEKVRIDSSGRVGIGTTTPRGLLSIANNNSVSGVVDSPLHFGYSLADYYGFRITNSNDPAATAAGLLKFQRGNLSGWVDAMAIDSSGNVGIGTTNPSYMLDVRGTLASASASSGGIVTCLSYATQGVVGTLSNHALTIYTNGSEKARIDTSGKVVIGTSAPTGTNTQLEVAGGTATELKIGATSANNTNFRGITFGLTGDATFYSGIRFQANSGELRYEAGFATWGGYQTFYTNGLERLRVDQVGNVGIGTNAPPVLLSVRGNSESLRLTSATTTSASYASIRNGNNILYTGVDDSTGSTFGAAYAGVIQVSGAYPLVLYTNSTERFRIDNTGNIGIGISSPSTKLHVYGGDLKIQKGTAYTDASELTFQTGSRTCRIISAYTDPVSITETYLAFHTNRTGQANDTVGEAMRLAGGNLGIGTTTPTVPLEVKSAVTGTPATSGTVQTTGVFRISSGATNGVLDFGTNSANPWIQSTDRTDLSQKYNLLLNPNGGKVGIGTTSPGAALHVSNGLDSNAGEFVGLIIGGTNATNARTASLVKDTTTYDLIYINQNFSGSAGSHVFKNGSAEHARLTYEGKLLVGTSSSPGGGACIATDGYAQYSKALGDKTAGSSYTVCTLGLQTTGKIKIYSNHNSGANYIEYSFCYSTNGKSLSLIHANSPYAPGAITLTLNNSTGVVSTNTLPYNTVITIAVECLAGVTASVGVTFP